MGAPTPVAARAALPRPRLAHLRRLTDDTGIIQHALGPVPDRSTGYTTDDNARALAVALKAAQLRCPGARSLARTYLAFLLYAQRPDGWFHNFFGYDRRPLPEERSEDCLGRALRALVHAARHWHERGPGWVARQLLTRALPACRQLRAPRGLAQAALAWAAWLEGYGPDRCGPLAAAAEQLLHAAAEALHGRYLQHRGPGWYWFEDVLTYDNAVLPHALLRAGHVAGRRDWVAAGLEALEFLCAATFPGGVFRPVGNRGFYPRGGRCAEFDQQPLEAAATVDACLEAWRLTGEAGWWERAWAAGRWFLGANTLGVPVADPDTGACCDGLTPAGVNLNQGAESTLAWLWTALLLHEARGPARVPALAGQRR